MKDKLDKDDIHGVIITVALVSTNFFANKRNWLGVLIASYVVSWVIYLALKITNELYAKVKKYQIDPLLKRVCTNHMEYLAESTEKYFVNYHKNPFKSAKVISCRFNNNNEIIEFQKMLEEDISNLLHMEPREKIRQVVHEITKNYRDMRELFFSIPEILLNLRPFLSKTKMIVDNFNKIESALKHLDYLLSKLGNEEKIIVSGSKEIAKMRGEDFEDLIKKIFEQRGYTVLKTPVTGDYGVDLIADKGGERIAIQCKRYSSGNTVGSSALMILKGGEAFYKANKSLLITTSVLTKNGRDAATTIMVDVWESERTFSEIEKSGVYKTSAEVSKKISRLKKIESDLTEYICSINEKNHDKLNLLVNDVLRIPKDAA